MNNRKLGLFVNKCHFLIMIAQALAIRTFPKITPYFQNYN